MNLWIGRQLKISIGVISIGIVLIGTAIIEAKLGVIGELRLCDE